ncbi:hypothetical protein RF11_08941 [Thelohanellus kitauei]|uniref:Serpin domain-containing protein n=1 Tax=Thelohanellus kitauei TaxID=669202 RepID=A0A0C2M6V9_THEKT|nr:hypothetical protein RF11_08941 [Thelohanellus kitauei]
MSDIAHIINNIFTHLLSSLDLSDGCDANYSFLPATIYITLLSILPLLDFPKKLLEYLDMPKDVLDDPEECQSLIKSLPKIVCNEHDSTVESFIKIYVHTKEHKRFELKHLLSSLLEIEYDKVSTHECQIVSVLLHEWSRQKLKNRDLRLLQIDPFVPEQDFIKAANTLYFSANWEHPFVEVHTKIANFHVDSDFTIPELFLNDCISMFKYSEVSVFLPKIKINDHINIQQHMKRLKFFKNEKQDKNIFDILDITQAVHLTVNEYGISTKYSPYQSARMERRRSVPPKCIHKINRPFIFMIYDLYYRCPLFVSTVFYPSRK